MKTVFFFLFGLLVSASCSATEYRVFSITGKFRVTTPTGETTLKDVNQIFECINPATDVKPFVKQKNYKIIFFETKTMLGNLYSISDCGAKTPCIKKTKMTGSIYHKTIILPFPINGLDTNTKIQKLRFDSSFKSQPTKINTKRQKFRFEKSPAAEKK